jgi:tetratricopeptide (TPR) repeat protein
VHAILHVELVEQTPTAFELRFWSDNPNDVRTRTLPLEEIRDLMELAETDYYSPLPLMLQETGERLFRWLDGGEHWLSAAIREVENRARVLVLAVATPHRLAHLPWEVLHNGSDYLIHALNPPVLPVRWRAAGPEGRAVKNQPLQLLFMASSPVDLQPVLDYEGEEHAILTATRRWPLDLTVEESGCLEELDALIRDHGDDFFDVLHLSGHAGHGEDQTPFFFLEDREGRRVEVTAYQLARTLFHRPPLVFLSGCRTAQNAGHGEVRSLAEQLVANGFRAVLGWGRPVRDSDAIRAAQHIYQHLASGDSIAVAVLRAHTLLRDDGVRDWHLLRLFCAGEPPAPLVTPLRAKGRRYAVGRPAESEFLDPLTKTVRVATRAGFVGRRRLLQSSLRALREREVPTIGLLLHGQGGRGKSSVAARLCDRLRRDYQRVVVIGRLDEPSLVNAWARELLDEDARRVLRDPAMELRLRIELTLHRLADTGSPAPLFVLDDFERNQPRAADGDLALAPHAEAVLSALSDALAHAAVGRVLATCRYALPAPFDGFLGAANVPPLDPTERMKQWLRLEQRSAWRSRDADLLEDAIGVADGNPRLLEWLHAVLEQPGLDPAAILDAMRGVEERFREHILARHLIASLSGEARVLLGRMLLLEEPAPLAAVRVLAPANDDVALRGMLDRAARLGLLDVTQEDGEPHYRVPRQLGGGDPPLLPIPEDAERTTLCGGMFEVLYRGWWKEADDRPERRILQLIRLAAEAGRKQEMVELSDEVTYRWLDTDRYRETSDLVEWLLPLTDRHPGLLLSIGRARQMLGDSKEGGRLLREAVSGSIHREPDLRAAVLFHYVLWLETQGELDEVVRISEAMIPLLVSLGWKEPLALVQSKIADVMRMRGKPGEALRIYRTEALPAFQHSEDQRGAAITLSKIADAHADLGELDEALRIFRDEVLPVYERLGIARERAVTLGKIADILKARGNLDETLHILREEVLPVFKDLNEIDLWGVTLGNIAEVLAERGELDEAVRIRRDEVLPIYERTNNVRELIVARFNLARMLLRRHRKRDSPEIAEHLTWSYQAAARRGYKEAAHIAAVMRQIGLPMPDPPRAPDHTLAHLDAGGAER